MSYKQTKENVTKNNILVKEPQNSSQGIAALRGKLNPTFKEAGSVDLQHQLATLWRRSTSK